MTQKGYPRAGVATGDGADAGPFTAPEWWAVWLAVARSGGLVDPTGPLRTLAALANIGVFYSVANQLEVTNPGGAANTLQIDTGSALVDGAFYYNDAAVTLTVPSSRTNDLIVVRKNFTAATYTPPASVDADEQVPAYTTRITRVTSLVQSTDRSTYWDVPLADFTTDAAGAVTLNSDDREYVDAETKTVLVPPRVGRDETGGSDIVVTSGAGGFGVWADTPQIVLPDAVISYAAGSWIVPSDFISNLAIRGMVETSANGNIYTRMLTQYATCGDAGATSENSGWQTIALTTPPPSIDCINSYSPTPPTSPDFFFMLFERDATGGDDTIVGSVRFLGFIVTYFGWR